LTAPALKAGRDGEAELEAPAVPVASALGIRGVEVVPGATGITGMLLLLT